MLQARHGNINPVVPCLREDLRRCKEAASSKLLIKLIIDFNNLVKFSMGKRYQMIFKSGHVIAL